MFHPSSSCVDCGWNSVLLSVGCSHIQVAVPVLGGSGIWPVYLSTDGVVGLWCGPCLLWFRLGPCGHCSSCRRLLTGCVLASREAWAVNCAFQVVLAHLLGLWVQDILVFCLQDWVCGLPSLGDAWASPHGRVPHGLEPVRPFVAGRLSGGMR